MLVWSYKELVQAVEIGSEADFDMCNTGYLRRSLDLLPYNPRLSFYIHTRRPHIAVHLGDIPDK